MPVDQAAALLVELRERLGTLAGPTGAPLPVQLVVPDEVYPQVRGVPPDLMLLVDDLRYRVVGSLGHGQLFPACNDQGADAANHARHGVVVMRDGLGARPAPADANLLDIAPTVLSLLGVTRPRSMRGKVL